MENLTDFYNSLPSDMPEALKVLITGAVEQLMLEAFYKGRIVNLKSKFISFEYETWESYKEEIKLIK